ncbi:hypothetical protein ABT330_05410 [Streptomyces sp. NPDC000658]|uniref:hypothetical protein n=1 Tax=Streptomyces sp. NPDC000658 TaxID=3154266 RepID=UPI00331C745D
MLVVETLQVVFIVAVLVLSTEKQVVNPLLLWTGAGFGTSQIITAPGAGLADGFLRLFVAVFAAIAIDKWRTGRGVTLWTAGPAALLSGLLIGWTV